MSKKLTKELIIEKAIKHPRLQGKGYTYPRFEYNGLNKKSIITCSIHGDFEQTPECHCIRGQGCPNCGGALKLEQLQFEEKANKTHGLGEFDYSVEPYKGINTHIKIKHNKCGIIFYQTPKMHCYGNGCPKCSIISRTENRTDTTKSFVEKILNKYPQNKNLYNYINSKYIKSNISIEILCLRCDKIFNQKPLKHLSGHGCPNCKFSRSRAENFINYLLEQNNINFESEKTFDTCKNINKLMFDFYLIDYNILIEFDGKQHFVPFSFNNDRSIETKQNNFEKLKFKDNIKNNWAKENNIPLIRISYLEEHLIEEKINKLIKFLKTNII